MQNSTHKKLQHRLLLMLVCLFLGFTVSAQEVLMTESFENGGAMPVGWAKTVVSGSDALGFVTTSSSPSGFTPTNGAYMVRFNSYNYSTAVNRLYTTSYFSTIAKENVTVQFSWLESLAYASSMDRVTVQWSPDGTTWFDGGTYDRPGDEDAWVTIKDTLPTLAQNQPSLHIGFLFTSSFGNNCFLDNVIVSGDDLAEPVLITIGSGTGNVAHPFYSLYEDSRTQILFTAAELISAGAAAGDITTLAFNVQSANSIALNGLNIDIQHTTASTLTGFVSSGWTNVYSGTHSCYLGWNTFTFNTPFKWDGTSNIIINVCFDNSDWSGSSYVYYTTVTGRTWHNHLDGATGCALTGGSVSTSRPNVQMTFDVTPPIPISIVQGYITNAYGIPIPDATVVATNQYGTFTTTSGPNGAYIMDDIFIGEYTMYAVKEGFNLVTVNNVLVYEGQPTNQNIALTQPSMAITPNPYTVTLNPNEYFTGAFNIANNGNGPLDWAATIEYMENDKSGYPVYTSVSVNDAPSSPNRAPAGTVPYDPTGELNNPSKDPTDIGYAYVAYALGGLIESPCSFMLNNPGLVTNFGSAAADFIAAADFVGDVWYGAIYGGSQFFTIDPVTGAYTNIGSTGDFVGMSYNHQNGMMYGLSYEGTLYTINLANGQTTVVGPTGTSGFIAFEIDNDGIGYAVNIDTDQLGTINLETGAWTTIGPVGFNASYAQDMSCDHSTNELYWAAYDAGTSQGKLLLVNKTNGSSQLIGTFPGGSEMDGFAIPGGAGGGWLTLGSESGTVNAFTNYSLPAYFSAEDTEAGEVYTATVTFTSDPNVGTVTIPVTMVIAGPPLTSPTNLSAVLTDPFIGQVSLSWSFQPTGDFINYVIKRNNVVVGYSTTTSFTNILPGYGIYEYTVQAVFTQGESLPAGPVEVEWPNPVIMVDPDYIYDEVWVNHQATEYLTINNTGEGTLSFSFPAWVQDNEKAPLAYCTASGGCDERISSVVFNTINNSTACSEYADYTSISTELQMGETYSIAITNSSPYSSDVAGVWIDWNHNELFTDPGEFYPTVSSGGASFAADITVPNTAMKGATRMRIRVQYGGTLDPCGSTSYGEVEDYTVNVVKTTGFIVGVHPATGIVPQGGSKTIAITWDATNFDPNQSYFENLVVESNDLDNPSITIVNEMYVYTPSQFEGTVTDINTGEPLSGVMVTATPTGDFTDYILDDGTNENGFGYNTAGDMGSIGNFYSTSDEGYLVSVDAYMYSGAAMSVPLNIEIYDTGHNLLGISAPIVINQEGWYTFTLPNIEFSGDFYCMLHWPMLSGSTRYLGWDENGPYSGANISYEFWDGTWYSMNDDWEYAGVFMLRPKAFVTGQVNPVTYMPLASNGTLGKSHLAMTNIAGDSGRGGVKTLDNNSTRDRAIFQTITNDQGEYSLIVDPGVYDVYFEKTAYQTLVVEDTAAVVGQTVVIDAQLREESYPPSFVYAEVNEDDTQVLVTWGDGSGPYEVVYDDGSAENMTAWALPGNMNAVKFTPASYPATVIGGRIYVGDGSFPNNNTGFIGVTFGAMVKDDDGPNGLPGTTLDSIQVVVLNYGWVTFTGLDAEITDGNFYLVMVQGSMSPNAAPIGVDQQMPIVYRSYSRNVSAGMPWALSPYQDFMMRALIYGNPSGDAVVEQIDSEVRVPLKQQGMLSMSAPMATAGGAEGTGLYKAALDINDNSRAVTGYRVVRFSGFNPDNAPETGTATNIAANVNGNSYTDAAWAGLPAGWYAYGVAALYPDGYVSDTTVSNVVGHLIDGVVTINVSLTTGGSPAGAVVSLTGLNYPYDVFTATVPEDGQVVFSPVYFGPYTLAASKVGFENYVFNLNISGNRTIDVMLAERKYKPRNLYVDPLTLVATWDEPLAYAVVEDFEGATFPPAGWQKLTQNTTGWYATTNGSSSSWTIPSHTKYAVVNDDADNGNGCCDYLITPEMDWTGLDSYRLSFASFYDGAYGESAYVELSTDAGESWTVIYTLSPATAWTEIGIDLAQFSGANGLNSVWIAFHADDNGAWASGWAIDDVVISSGGIPLQGYGVFLDGTLVGNTMEQTFTYTNLNYGQEYLAGVAALFSSGYSELDTYLFRSLYLVPPDSLKGMSPQSTDYVYLTWNEPVATGGGGQGGTLIEDFEAGTLPEGWLSIDVDGDGYKWDNTAIEFTAFDAHTGAYCMTSASYRNDVGVLNPNNWLITPAIQIGSQSELRFWVDAQDPSYAAEQYYVKVSTTGTDIDDFTETIHSAISTGNWQEIVLDLGQFAGNQVYIAFVHADVSDMFFIKIDDVSIANATGMWPATTPVAPGISQAMPFRTSDMTTDQINSTLAQYNESVVKNPVRSVRGIKGYNVYRGESMVGYVDHPTTEYYDLNLNPGTYTYNVTAVYDLTSYGFPFQTGESMKEGPVDVDVIYGFELPFVEDFTSGTFTTNKWSIDGSNWTIDGQQGNPAPSAKFTYTPHQIDYALSLSSSWMIGKGFVDGKIYLDFDLKLDDNNATGDEQLLVEVFNGTAWQNVETYTAEGDKNWETKHVDITSGAKGNVFRVRFTAKGLNSLDINNWQIDNVHIYRLCEAPTNLTANLPDPDNHGDQILLTWEGPEIPQPVAEWIFYDDGVNSSGIGVGVDATWAAAVRFTTAQLAEYVGANLTKIRFVPANAAGSSFVLKVWTGANASNLVLSQPVSSFIAGTWNEYTLNTPIAITGTTELWFGYEVTQAAADFPAGCDNGPAIDGYGNMVNLDGVWETLYSLNSALNYNWNIQGFVETPAAFTPEALPIAENTVYNAQGTLTRSDVTYVNGAVAPTTGSREFTGFNIYRDGVLIANTTETEYLDTDPAISIFMQEFCYNVTAVYTDCESEFSNVACATVVKTEGPELGAVSIYPNPSNSVVNIELTNDISHIVIYNGVGQVVKEMNIAKDKLIQIDVRTYEAGAYLVKFITNDGNSFARKIAVTK